MFINKRVHLVTQTRQAEHHYLHRLFCHIARVPPAAACSHTTTLPLNREVSNRTFDRTHHPLQFLEVCMNPTLPPLHCSQITAYQKVSFPPKCWFLMSDSSLSDSVLLTKNVKPKSNYF